jgi:hypothetical protein
MYPGTPSYRPKPPSQGTAETLTLIAWILQFLFSLIAIFFGAIALTAGTFLLFFPAAGILVLLVGALLVIVPILLLYVGYAFSYRRISTGDFAGARGPTLLLAILGFPFGAVIVGILYLVAYLKIDDAENESRAMSAWPGQGYGAPPGYYGGGMPYAGGPVGAPALHGGVAYAPAPMAPVAMNCPRCGRPATFIPQYGRSYCYSCAQYL